MKNLIKFVLLCNLAALVFNGISIFTVDPRISVVFFLINAAAVYVLAIDLRKYSPLYQLRARLNPKRLEHPFQLIIRDTMHDKTIEINVTEAPGIITEGDVEVRIGEDRRVDIYFEGRLSQTLYIENLPND